MEETISVTNPVIVRAITAHKKEIERLRKDRDHQIDIRNELIDELHDEIEKLRQQRDELLAALEMTIHPRCDCDSCCFSRAAVAKCK